MDFNRYIGVVYIMKKLIIISVLVVALIACSKKEEKLPPVAPAYIVENLESMPYYADSLLPQKIEKYNLTLSEPAKTIRPKELNDSMLTQIQKLQNSIPIEGLAQNERIRAPINSKQEYYRMEISKNEKYLNHHFIGGYIWRIQV